VSAGGVSELEGKHVFEGTQNLNTLMKCY